MEVIGRGFGVETSFVRGRHDTCANDLLLQEFLLLDHFC